MSGATVGNLKQALGFWENDLKASPYVLHMIRDGYRVPFYSMPPPSQEKNNASALRHPDFVEQEIRHLLLDGRIIESLTTPHTVKPLTVSEGKKLRLVLDLRNIN